MSIVAPSHDSQKCNPPVVFVTFPIGLRPPERAAIREGALRAYPGATLRFAWHYKGDEKRLAQAIVSSHALIFAPGPKGWIGTGVMRELKFARASDKRCYALDPATGVLHTCVFIAERPENQERRTRVVRLAFDEPFPGAPMLLVDPRRTEH